MDDLFNANVEALANSETGKAKGRWRTVACGGFSFANWRTYCCPSDYYDNCPDKGDCESSFIQGC